jgi:hypothetical protein
MRVTLESTDKVVDLMFEDGQIVPARIWEGETSSGIPCHAYITRIAVHNQDDGSAFERELLQQRPPHNPDVAALPRRLVI